MTSKLDLFRHYPLTSGLRLCEHQILTYISFSYTSASCSINIPAFLQTQICVLRPSVLTKLNGKKFSPPLKDNVPQQQSWAISMYNILPLWQTSTLLPIFYQYSTTGELNFSATTFGSTKWSLVGSHKHNDYGHPTQHTSQLRSHEHMVYNTIMQMTALFISVQCPRQ